MTIDPVLSEDVSSLRAEIAELGKQIQIAGQTRQKDLARGPFIIVHQSWMRFFFFIFVEGLRIPKPQSHQPFPSGVYDLCYHITIHYSHCRIFYHGSLMVVGYVGKNMLLYDFTQDKHDKLYRTPPKKIDRGFQDSIDEVFPSPGFQLGHLFGDFL